MVSHFLRHNNFDVEDIAVKLWIEIYETNGHLTWTFVKNRCIDELRKKRLLFASFDELDSIEKFGDDTSESNVILLNKIMEETRLSPQEKLEIFKRFYQDEPLKKVDENTVLQALKKLRATVDLLRKELL